MNSGASSHNVNLKRNYKRQHKRAPLKTTLLFADGEHVFKAKTVNISEGGILVESFPCFPQTNIVAIMIGIPTVFSFENETIASLQEYLDLGYPSLIFRSTIKTLRKSEFPAESIDQLLMKNIGCQFQNPSNELTESIRKYVEQTFKNMVYLLNLLEKSSKWSLQSQKKMSLMAENLGYPANLSCSQYHQLINHDYVSILNA